MMSRMQSLVGARPRPNGAVKPAAESLFNTKEEKAPMDRGFRREWGSECEQKEATSSPERWLPLS
jgi:hypothetical protein